MASFFKKITNQFFDEMLVAQSFYFKQWVIESFPHEKHVWYVSTKYFDKKINLTDKKNPPPVFFLTTNNCKNILIKKLHMNYGIKENHWVVIFSNPFFSVYQNTEEEKSSLILTSFEPSLQKKLLVSARGVVVTLATHGKPTALDDLFFDSPIKNNFYHIDVTLWVHGALRGSKIVFNKDLYNGVKMAAYASYYDSRFTQVSREELDRMRIEVVVMSTLALPVLRSDIATDNIHHDKSYSLNIENNTGWFLPTVFNCIFFGGLFDFTKRLAEEKLNIPFKSNYVNKLVMHQTVSCIESSDHQLVLDVNGPLVKNSNSKDGGMDIKKALAYLRKIQNNDGSFPSRLNPLRKEMYYDPILLAFTVYSLIIYGNKRQNLESKVIGEKGLMYLLSHVDGTTKNDAMILVSVYTAFALWHKGDVEKCLYLVSCIVSKLGGLAYEPILYSQIAKLFITVHGSSSEYLSYIKKIVSTVHYDFSTRKKIGSVDLVVYVELPWLLESVGDILSDSSLKKDSRDIGLWYMSLQKEDGAFPCKTDNPFVYVRGVSKIIEALAPLEYINKESLRKGLSWCSQFQYSKENTYFMEPGMASLIEGGIRHDYYNHEAWSDSIGHILIASCLL